MCFIYIYIYIILSTTVSHFWTLRMPFFYKVSLFCIHFHMLSSCSVDGFKCQLDDYLGALPILSASLDSIIVWMVGIVLMEVTTQIS